MLKQYKWTFDSHELLDINDQFAPKSKVGPNGKSCRNVALLNSKSCFNVVKSFRLT